MRQCSDPAARSTDPRKIKRSQPHQLAGLTRPVALIEIVEHRSRCRRGIGVINPLARKLPDQPRIQRADGQPLFISRLFDRINLSDQPTDSFNIRLLAGDIELLGVSLSEDYLDAGDTVVFSVELTNSGTAEVRNTVVIPKFNLLWIDKYKL